ncbi:MAG: glyoxylate/hydroxypyruvate reductase A [Acidimicrobiia bacterium]|nr:glyoxylate/hydroxypyruvate reductase A [Acidimicrobiia bacterium]
MSIVVNPASRPDQWMAAMAAELPEEDLFLWPQVGASGSVEYVLAWEMTIEDLTDFPNLKAVFSLGAGVDQWMGLAEHPELGSVDVVRLVDPAMSDQMAAYALHWVLHYQRGFDQVAGLKQQRQFKPPSQTDGSDYTVGILGHGNIGRRVSQAFIDLGYPINAWTRSGGRGHPDPSVTHFIGSEQLDDFLAASRAVVNVLPNTDETLGLLDRKRLAAFAPGSVFINMGRGTVVKETDLLNALDDGPLRAAVLDVTDPEPPPSASALFEHPKVVLTGHCAGMTVVSTASRVIADNIRRLRRGEAAFPLLDPERGY